MVSLMNIEFSIWGIREGFEKNGMFHTHENDVIKTIQQDRFRTLSKKAGSEGFFMINRHAGFVMISFVDTKIREAITSEHQKRPGYVVFSLILPIGLQLNESPRLILKAISAFYVDCVKEDTRNNFNEEDIRHFLSVLTTRPKDSSATLVEGSFYSYYTDENQLDIFLTGNARLANLSEWLWIPDSLRIHTNVDLYDTAFGKTPKYFDVEQEREKQEKTKEWQEAEYNKRIIEEEQRTKDIAEFEEKLGHYLSQNRTDEALKLWNASPYKINVSAGLTTRLKSLEQDLLINQVSTQQLKEDDDSLAKLNRSFQDNNLEEALIYFHKLHNKNHPKLDLDIKKRVMFFSTEKQSKQKEEEEKDRTIRIKQEKNKRLKKQISLAIIGLVLITSVLSYFTMVPAFLWDGDGDGFHTCRTDNCPDKFGKTCMGCPDTDKDGIADLDDACPNLFGNKSAKGCPDADGDSVKDADDSCSSVRGTVGCYGCPDADGDNTADSIDKCPTVSGPVSNDGCEEDAVKGPGKIVEKPNATRAIKVPNNFYNLIIEDKWLKFIDGHYEFSDYEKKDYKPVASQETVNKLNEYYQLKGTLKNDKGPEKVDDTIVNDPPQTKSKLTTIQQTELNKLLEKEKIGPLNAEEKSRKITLQNL